MAWRNGGGAMIVASPHLAAAQDYPTRPITMIVPFPAGGPTDTFARIMAGRMGEALGQPVVIENVGGANGTIGVGRVARALPDGYTLGIGQWSTNVVNGAVYDLSYDLLKDFAPVARLVSGPQLLVANKNLPANDLAEFIAWLKKNPGKALAGTAGVGSQQHVSGVYFQTATKTNVHFVPYRGAAPAMQDLIGRPEHHFDVRSGCAFPAAGEGPARSRLSPLRRKKRAPRFGARDPDHRRGRPAGGSIFPFLRALTGSGRDAARHRRQAQCRRGRGDGRSPCPDAVCRARTGYAAAAASRRRKRSGVFQKAEIEKWWPLIKGRQIKAE